MASHRRSAPPLGQPGRRRQDDRDGQADFTTHDATQLVVAVVAEHPERIVGNLDLLPNQNQIAPAIVTLTPDDLPERVEAWSAIDRIVWQDVDSERLSTPQRDALPRLGRRWRTTRHRRRDRRPEDPLGVPRQPAPLPAGRHHRCPGLDLSGILGQLPPGAAALPALSGSLIGGRTLATVGDQVVAAERPYGSGSVAFIGFDPTVDWIAKTDTLGQPVAPPPARRGRAAASRSATTASS